MIISVSATAAELRERGINWSAGYLRHWHYREGPRRWRLSALAYDVYADFLDDMADHLASRWERIPPGKAKETRAGVAGCYWGSPKYVAAAVIMARECAMYKWGVHHSTKRSLLGSRERDYWAPTLLYIDGVVVRPKGQTHAIACRKLAEKAVATTRIIEEVLQDA